MNAKRNDKKGEYEQKLDRKKWNTNRNWTGKSGIQTEIGQGNGNMNRNWTVKKGIRTEIGHEKEEEKEM